MVGQGVAPRFEIWAERPLNGGRVRRDSISADLRGKGGSASLDRWGGRRHKMIVAAEATRERTGRAGSRRGSRDAHPNHFGGDSPQRRFRESLGAPRSFGFLNNLDNSVDRLDLDLNRTDATRLLDGAKVASFRLVLICPGRPAIFPDDLRAPANQKRTRSSARASISIDEVGRRDFPRRKVNQGERSSRGPSDPTQQEGDCSCPSARN